MFEELFREHHTGERLDLDHGTDRPLACVILDAAVSESEELYVHVPELGPNERRGPCKWTPRPGVGGPVLPKGGEEAIMQFDTEGKPWIVQWWPFE